MTDMEAIERVREDLASLDKHHMKPVETVWHTSDVRALLSALDRKDEEIARLRAGLNSIRQILDLAGDLEDDEKMEINGGLLRAMKLAVEEAENGAKKEIGHG